MASPWSDPAVWEEKKRQESCPICVHGQPLDVLADFPASWVTGGEDAPLPGYACVFSKHHVIEPFHLPPADAGAFWGDVMAAARVLDLLFKPTKMNYEIHGNTIPHLHAHLFPRFAEDPFVGGPIDPRRPQFKRTKDDLRRMRQALEDALGS
jgi:diadenosine tetraphosphate (Ap4A) HIT family hydrolase